MLAFIQKYLDQFDIDAFLMKLVSLFLLYICFLLAKKIIHIIVKRALSSSLRLGSQDLARQKTVIRLVENSLNYAIWFFMVYSMLAVFGVPVYSLLAGAGIAGVAIGLGAQGFLSDLVNGFFILIERQFDVGDQVNLTNGPIMVSGTISGVGIRTTQVRDADGTLHFIPNRNILVVSNKSRGDMRIQIDLPLSITVDFELVRQIIEEVHARELPHYEQVKGVTILGPQTLKTGQFVYRIQLMVENGQQSKLYPIFYAFYQEALLQAGVDFLMQV